MQHAKRGDAKCQDKASERQDFVLAGLPECLRLGSGKDEDRAAQAQILGEIDQPAGEIAKRRAPGPRIARRMEYQENVDERAEQEDLYAQQCRRQLCVFPEDDRHTGGHDGDRREIGPEHVPRDPRRYDACHKSGINEVQDGVDEHRKGEQEPALFGDAIEGHFNQC
jgi:hypothetical protein